MTELPSEPVYELVEITPTVAEQMLGRNGHNRNLRARVVASYVADMTEGRWTENGETIKVGVDGTLIDGQHRLHAIVESGTTHRMMVISNLPLAAQETIDTGSRRSFADVLKLRKEANWVDVAAVTRRVYLWERGARRNSGNTQPSVPQMLATLEAHPEIRYSAEVANRVSRRLPVPKSVIGLCHWLFSQIDAYDCEVFFDRLADGADLSKTDPVFVLRRAVIDNANGSSVARFGDVVLTVYVIKAWNAYRAGDEMKILRWRAGGANPEAFPEPK